MNNQKYLLGLALAACVISPGVRAEATGGDNVFTDVAGRWYISPMYSTTRADKERGSDDGTGWMLSVGKQVNRYFHFEAYGFQTDYDSLVGGQKDGKLEGLGLSAYGFPFAQHSGGSGLWLGGAYGLVGVAYADGKDFPERTGFFDQNTNRYVLDAGVGYLMRIPFVRFASLRFDARYRLDLVDNPFASNDPDTENDEPSFEEMVLSVGLLIPIGSRPVPAPEPATVVAVIAPVSICADGQDNDGDGQIDFPNDPGCSAADDSDETDPPVCADGKDNDGDGLIDFPSDKGCIAADDADEVDPCKTPAPGERISLKGCGTGDIIVLRGVNFEFDKSRLTANAKTILDNVSEELIAYPEIEVELGGHTDSKGSDSYNQSLSDRRSKSVRSYLVGKGIAGDRMTTAGFGENQPVADNETDEGRELNRRTELKVTQGVAPGGPTVVENTAVEAPTVADPAATDGASPDVATTP